jgi:hypothetical protein
MAVPGSCRLVLPRSSYHERLILIHARMRLAPATPSPAVGNRLFCPWSIRDTELVLHTFLVALHLLPSASKNGDRERIPRAWRMMMMISTMWLTRPPAQNVERDCLESRVISIEYGKIPADFAEIQVIAKRNTDCTFVKAHSSRLAVMNIKG